MIFAPLKLSNVKPCSPAVADRNHCFVLRTSSSEYILQAADSKDYEEWMMEIQDGIMQALDDCEPERSRTYARGDSLKESGEKRPTFVENVVERIKAVEGNTNCADCNCPTPGWASTNIGVVICIECSGIHRGLGVQISKIKSLSLDKWDSVTVDFMEAHGNTKMNSVLEANLTIPKITRSSSKKDRLEYIVAKYVNKSFISKQVEEVEQPESDDVADDADLQFSEGQHQQFSEEGFPDSNSLSPPPPSELVLSDSADEDAPALNHSVTCLVKECEEDTHTHPPST